MVKILVVEEEPGIARLCTNILELAGYEAGMATNEKELVESIQKERFDILIVDLDMRHMNGLECALRAKEINPESGFIFMTGSSDLAERERVGMKKLAYRVIPKPFAPEELEEAVKSFIKNKA